MEPTVKAVCDDIKFRKIIFPSFCDLKAPLRSTLDGLQLTPDSDGSVSLVETILRLLLVHPVNWQMTAEAISTMVVKRIELTNNQPIQVQSFGPGSTYLLSAMQALRNYEKAGGLQIVDESYSSSSKPLRGPGENDIAIVGMAVDFPKSKGVNALWDSLANGTNALEEVFRGHLHHWP